jgi:hypothetical protein
MFDRLIWLTPIGIAACEHRNTADTVAHEESTDIYARLAALRETYAHIGAASTDRELVRQ